MYEIALKLVQEALICVENNNYDTADEKYRSSIELTEQEKPYFIAEYFKFLINITK